MDTGGAFGFLGVPLVSSPIPTVVRGIMGAVTRGLHTYVCVVSSHGIVMAQRDASFMKILRASGWNVTDGMPLVWAARIAGVERASRVYGPDLFLAVLDAAERMRVPVFLYGTTKETLDKLTGNLRRKYPRLVIAGVHAPPFRQETDAERRRTIGAINRSRARIVFVGLSTPKQERWMSENAGHLRANVLVGVGAAFDFTAGVVRQAPPFMRRSGTEWLYRLFQEPARLWRRYAEILILLPWYVLLSTAFRAHERCRRGVAVRK